MTPLNIWLTEAEQRGDMQAMEHGVLNMATRLKIWLRRIFSRRHAV
jgi:hypothetical protein